MRIGELTPKAQIIRHFERTEQQKEGAITKCFESLKSLKWHTFSRPFVSSSCYEVIWEHPVFTEYNSKLKQSQILSTQYCTLYGVLQEDDLPEVFRNEPFVFLFGRIGNTKDFFFKPPETLFDDRRDNGQLELFEESSNE